MLTPVEQMLFLILSLLALGAAYAGFRDMVDVIGRGQRELYLDRLPARVITALRVYLTQNTTLKMRRRWITSLFHLAVVWGFTYYFLVNAADVIGGFMPNYVFLADAGVLGGIYQLGGDLFSVAVIVGVIYLMIRRLYLPSRKELTFHDNVLLHPKVKAGAIRRDSLIVAWFILIHVGSRFLGQSVEVAASGADVLRPFATLVSPLWGSLNPDGLLVLEHLFWWLALGAILLFLPYFPYTKHLHLIMAPINFLTRPRRTSLGEMEKLDFEDETRDQFGAQQARRPRPDQHSRRLRLYHVQPLSGRLPGLRDRQGTLALGAGGQQALLDQGSDARTGGGRALRSPADGLRAERVGSVGVYLVRRVHRHLSGRQRADVRHPQHSTGRRADAGRVPGGTARRVQRHGAAGQSLGQPARRPLPLGERLGRADCR